MTSECTITLFAYYVNGDPLQQQGSETLNLEVYSCQDMTLNPQTYSDLKYDIADSQLSVILSLWSYNAGYQCGNIIYNAFLVNNVTGSLNSLPSYIQFSGESMVF